MNLNIVILFKYGVETYSYVNETWKKNTLEIM